MSGAMYAAVWHPADYGTRFEVNKTFESFNETVTERHAAGWRLMRARSVSHGDKVRWSGLWRDGINAKSRLKVERNENAFQAEAADLKADGYTLIDVDGRTSGSGTLWTGVYLGGKEDFRFSPSQTWGELATLADKRHDNGWSLVRVVPHKAAGELRYAGLWRRGEAANYYRRFSAWGDFWAESGKQFTAGNHLTDFQPYWDGGTLSVVAVWLTGPKGSISRYVDREGLLAASRLHRSQGNGLQSVSVVDYPCDAMNQAVMPAEHNDNNGATVVTGSYNYGITATATHCEGVPGSCPSPAPGGQVWYRWPVDVVNDDGTERYLRLDSIAGPAKFLTLPFTDRDVKRGGIWRYSSAKWHHAGDFSQSGGKTFEIVASAKGQVIHIGWDSWSGNTIVVSHDVGGTTDAYRTIYMHLRNSPTKDAAAAWDVSVASTDMKDSDRTKYVDLLKKTGCPKTVADRDPDPDYWGTTSEAIKTSLLGTTVKAGAFLAWAGCTGPGGMLGYNETPNTHLHMFWARRDPSNGLWYLFDPYGIYSTPDNYPAGVTDQLGWCARWGTAWKGGAPAYPA